MKNMTLICLLAISFILNAGMIINPVTGVNFGPVEVKVFGNIVLKTSKNKAVGVNFNTSTELIMVGYGQDSIFNISSVPNLTLNKSNGDLWLTADLSVTDSLQFVSGNIKTGTDTLKLINTSTVTGESASAFINGALKASKSIGTTSGDICGTGFVINDTGNDLGTVTVIRNTGSGSQETIDDNEGIKRSWEVLTSLPFTGTRNVTVSWFDSEDNSNRLDDLRAWKYSGSWSDISGASFDYDQPVRTGTFSIDAEAKYTLNNTYTYFAGGTGAWDDPYLIRTAQHLDSLRYYLTPEFNYYSFKQIADIDLGVSPWNDGNGWDPIGATSTPFKSYYDGNAYAINNLTIDRTSDHEVGLFGVVNQSSITDLTLNNADVTGSYIVGTLVGLCDSMSYVSNCKSTGVVSVDSIAGGLIGKISEMSLVDSCYAVTNVSASSVISGGLVGESYNWSSITNSGAEGTVISPQYAGGLVGMNSTTSITYCYAGGNVSGINYLGGLLGYDYDSDVYDSYAWGDVDGTGYLGGLLGYAYDTYIYNTYSIGSITGFNYIGGLVGYENYTTADYSYWNTQTSGQDSSAVGNGKTTAEMTYPRDMMTYSGWDFDMMPVWNINYGANNGYPYLYWQDVPITCFAGGSGTGVDPYLISNATELNAVRYYLDKFFQQTTDIDIGVSPWTDSTGWVPIGDMSGYSFKGVYNGAGYKVSNLTVNDSTLFCSGLFGYAEGSSQIKSLEVVDAQVVGDMSVGVLLGYGFGTSLNDCGASGTVYANMDTGGLVGMADGMQIERCYSTADVDVQWSNAGGLAGYLNQGTYVSDSYSSGDVNCYDMVGGFAGYNYISTIENCYSTGLVTTLMTAGGLVGGNDSGSAIYSYWDTETSGQSSSPLGKGRTTADMTYPYTDSTYVNWDFSTPDWVIVNGVNSGYPYLVWQDMGGLSSPTNLTTSVSGTDLTISWDAVTGAAGYAVYSSDDPYGTFVLDGSGSFNGEEWTVSLTGSKMFYYVTSTDSKRPVAKTIKIKKSVAYR